MILTELNERVKIDRQQFQTMPEDKLSELVSKAQASYINGLAASRAGEEAEARKRYKIAFELLPTHTEALDNCAIGLVEELRFADAIPFLEQSACAEPQSALAFCYLTKCYQETGQNKLALQCIEYLKNNWPDKSPVVDWSFLGKPKPDLELASPPYREGQVWKFRDTPEFASSKVWIRLVDIEKGDPVVHVSVLHKDAAGKEIFISHLPYDPQGLKESNLELTDEQHQWDLPDDHFGEGFGIWREAFDAEQAGVFAETVSDVVTDLLKQME